MHIYKFRIVTDINEEFFRDVEIKSTQTFEDLHFLLVNELKFSDKELASFYLCDNRWNKKQEITYIEMGDDENPIPEMKNSRLCDFIDDPHQHILWVYDFLNLKSFYVELTKITPALNNVEYPRIIAANGEISLKTNKLNTDALSFIDEEFENQFPDFKENDNDSFSNDDVEEDDDDDKNIEVDNDEFF